MQPSSLQNLCEACHSTDDKIIEALDFAGRDRVQTDSPNHSPLTKIEETSECSEPVISGLNHKAMTQSAIFMAEKTIEGTADLFDIDAGYDID
ncbi:hypothetical protein J6590_056702 [Homalodisca vitripennis]|nr:hypothetical protein J6590_056702 [Homalodisca vitripennis]